jgi:DNA-binding PadR family transcriptional regulator
VSATRLLVLGAIRGFGRAHGYLVRQELVSWGADRWAHIKWGSLYHALRKLTDEELLRATEIAEWPGRVDYELTAAGEAEFFQLLRAALRDPSPRPDTLAAGLSLLPALTRAEAIALLRQRLNTLERSRDEVQQRIRCWTEEPPHVQELFGLWAHTAARGAEWTRGMITRLQTGKYHLAGEPDATFGIRGTWPVS